MPNEVWSWDITKLRGPAKWTHFYLYVILDIYSRCAVGWMVARRESAALANRLIHDTYQKHNIEPGQLPEAVWLNPPKAPSEGGHFYTNFQSGLSQYA